MSSVKDFGVARTTDGEGSERLALRFLIGQKFVTPLTFISCF
jgi:hypothetical protein